MPFEIAQPEVKVEVKVGRFQWAADAILRGCAVTGPTTCLKDGKNTCALGAMGVGLGVPHEHAPLVEFVNRDAVWEVCSAYTARYDTYLRRDNDSYRFTREEIAERIRALR